MNATQVAPSPVAPQLAAPPQTALPGVSVAPRPLHIRHLGKVAYQDAWALQRGLFHHSSDNHLLLLEHPHVFTLGTNADEKHLLVKAGGTASGGTANSSFEVHQVDRGGDITYHGPGQLVGYPILSLLVRKPSGEVQAKGMINTSAYVYQVEQLLIDTLLEFGISNVGRVARYRGVWMRPTSDTPKKIAAIGVRLRRGRTMHGFALNVKCDLEWFKKIVPCGIADFGVTSMAEQGVDATVEEVADCVAELAGELWGDNTACEDKSGWSYAKASPPWQLEDALMRNLAKTENLKTENHSKQPETNQPETAISLRTKKPEWMRVNLKDRLDESSKYWQLKGVMQSLELTTVCEEAGCPNISECWGAGTATFMINGERCTRSCGFCLVDTRKPVAADPQEPVRLATAVKEMDLDYAVITAVARDDLADGGASGFVNCLREIRRTTPSVSVEVLIPDFKGNTEALDSVFAERPEVLNHNIETPLRLQRQVRPQASYARSLAVLSRAKEAGLTTKSSIIMGLGETETELAETMADLAGIGCDIVTLGQYLRPSAKHLPIMRWWHPDEFQRLKTLGEEMGISHVEAGPLVRSSYHAADAMSSAMDSAMGSAMDSAIVANKREADS